MALDAVSTSDASFAYSRETVYGTTDNVDQKGLRATSNTIEQTQGSERSAEISSGVPQVRDSIRVGVEVGGDLNFELSLLSHDDFWESAFRSSFTKTPEHIGDTKVTAATNSSSTFTVTNETAPLFSGTDYVQYHLVYAENFAEVANNGLHVVDAGGSGTAVVVTSTLTDEADPPTAAQIKVVGFEAPDNDLGAVSDGITSTTLDFTTLGLTVGQWLKIGGTAAANQFDDANNNAMVRISAITANKITLDRLPANWATESAQVGKSVRVFFGDTMRNGAEKHSYTISEKVSTGLTKVATGCRIGGIEFSLSSEQIISGSFNVVGALMDAATDVPGTGTVTDAPGTDVLNSIDNIDSIFVKGAAATIVIQQMSVSVDLGLRGQKAISVLGNAGVATGRFTINGGLTAYYDDTDGLQLYKDFLGNTATDYAFRLIDAAAKKALMFDVKRVKLTTGDMGNPGEEQDRVITLEWEGVVDGGATERVAQLDRFAYVE